MPLPGLSLVKRRTGAYFTHYIYMIVSVTTKRTVLSNICLNIFNNGEKNVLKCLLVY